VTLAVSQMDEVTQQNAALVEEAAAAAESLEEQARGLVQSVSSFNLGLAGSTFSATQAPARRAVRKPVAKALPVSSSGARPMSRAPAHLDAPDDEWAEF
ncbi:MAG: methyl-accepting chemotaxis protein, partial [Zoogloea sp.]